MVLVEHELQNAYIWQYPGWWQPWANTLAYRPLTSDLNDYSWNNHNFSATSWTYSFNNNMCTLQRATLSWWSMAGYAGDFTIQAYTTNSSANSGIQLQTDNRWYPSVQLYRGGDDIWFNFVNSTNTARIWAGNSYTWTWVHLITWVKTSTYVALYIDGVEQQKVVWSYGDMYNSSQKNCRLWRNVNGSWTATYWNIILESVARTAQEIADYYNQTKANYWIS